MTSIRSSFNIFHYLRYQLRQNLWLIFVLGLVYVLMGPAVMFLVLTSRLSRLPFSGETLQDPVLLKDLSTMVHLNAWLPLYATAVVSGVLLAMVVGVYLNVRRQTNFYHSLPVRRNQLLAAQIGEGFAIHSIIMLISLVLCYLVAVVVLPPNLLQGSWFLIHFLQIELVFLVSFFLTILAGQLTGNGLAQLAMTLVLHFAPLVIAGILALVFSTQLVTYVQMDWVEGLTHWNLPSLLVYYANDVNILYRDLGIVAPWMPGRYLMGLVLVAVVTIVLSALLYRRMESERVSDTLLFDWVALPVKAFFLFWAPLLMGLLFMLATDESLPTFLVGFVLAGLLTHVLAEIAFHQNVKAVRKYAPSSIIFLVITLLFFLGTRADIAGFNTYLPAEERIAAMSISSPSYKNNSLYPGTFREKKASFTDRDTIAKAHDLVEKATTHHVGRKEIKRGPTLDSANSQEPVYWDQLNVGYTLTNGRTVERTYTVPRETIQSEAGALYEDDSFRLVLWDFLFDTNPEDVVHLSVNMRSFLNGSLLMDSGDQVLLYGESGFSRDVPEDTVNRLINALRQDISERSYADLNSDTLALVNIGHDRGTGRNAGQVEAVPVLESDRHTLAVLADLSDLGLFTMGEARIAEEGITEVVLVRTESVVSKNGTDFSSGSEETSPTNDAIGYEEIASTKDPATISDWLLNRSLGYDRLSEFGVEPAQDLAFVIRSSEGAEIQRPVNKERLPKINERSVT